MMQADKGKSVRRAAKPIDPSKCYINLIPDELLIGCFSHLDPRSLRLIASTSRRFARVLTDDSCWRSAFLQFWSQREPHRRTRSTWREEFLFRSRLRNDFVAVRTHSVIASPGLGNIVSLAFPRDDPRRCFMAGESGVIGRCDVLTGKIAREVWDGGYGPEGTACRIWGNRFMHAHADTLSVTLTTGLPKEGSANNGAVQLTRLDGHPFSAGAVRVVSWSGSKYLATGTERGEVRVWEVTKWGESGRCLWTGQVDEIGDGFTSVCLLSSSVVVAATRRRLFIFRVAAPESASLVHAPADSLALPDPGSEASLLGVCKTLTVLVPTSLGEIWMVDAATGRKVAVLGGLQAAVTAVTWDIGAGSGDNETPLSPQVSAAPHLETHFPRIVAVVAADDEGHLAAYDLGGMACFWRQGDDSTGVPVAPVRRWRAHYSRVLHVRIDAVRIVSAAADGVLKMFDAVSHTLLRSMNSRYFKSSTSATHSALSRGGNNNNNAGEQAGVRELYDPNDRKLIRSVALSSDFKSVVIAIGENLRTWSYGALDTGNSGGGRRKSLPGGPITGFDTDRTRHVPTINGVAVANNNNNNIADTIISNSQRRKSLDVGESKKDLHNEIKRETRTTIKRLEMEREARSFASEQSFEEQLQLAMAMSISQQPSAAGNLEVGAAPTSRLLSRSFDDRVLRLPRSSSARSRSGVPDAQDFDFIEEDHDDSLDGNKDNNDDDDDDYDEDLEDLRLELPGINISSTGAVNKGRTQRRRRGSGRGSSGGNQQQPVSAMNSPPFGAVFPVSPRSNSEVPGSVAWIAQAQRRNSEPQTSTERERTEAEQLALALALSMLDK